MQQQNGHMLNTDSEVLEVEIEEPLPHFIHVPFFLYVFTILVTGFSIVSSAMESE